MRSDNCWNKDKTLFVAKGFLAEVVKNQKSVTFYKMSKDRWVLLNLLKHNNNVVLKRESQSFGSSLKTW